MSPVERRSEARRKWREKNPGYHAAYHGAHRAEAKRNREAWAAANPEKMREARRLSRAKYPDRIRARGAVANALRRGKLFKRPCEVCGEPKVQAHHDDYSKPLEVRWLCQVHHDKEHHG